MSELKEKKKIKVVALYRWTPKQFEPQNSLFLQKKKKKITLNKIKLKARMEGDIVNICKFLHPFL